MPTRIFVYGTLLDPRVFQRVTVSPQPRPIAARLKGWRRVRLARLPYPTLHRDPRGQVEGAVLPVGQVALARLHRYETKLYRFVPVTVRAGGRRIAAHAWITRSHAASPRTNWHPG